MRDDARSKPAIVTRPASGDDSPHNCRSVVVLPLPFAPTSSVTSPGVDEIESLSTRGGRRIC